MIQYRDEFSTLVGTFGMYKNGGSGFDRSIYLTLYNGEDTFSHQTKTLSITIDKPRLSIFSAAHPGYIRTFLDEDKGYMQDGFISRFLICFPIKHRMTLEEQIAYGEFKNKINFVKLFLVIHYAHIVPVQYELSPESIKLVSSTFTKFEDVCEYYEKDDNFIP